jgi:hypothetical protein
VPRPAAVVPPHAPLVPPPAPVVLPPARVPGPAIWTPDNTSADDLAFAQDVEWQQWSTEDKEREPAPGYYVRFGVPYGTGRDIPGGR